MLRARSALFIAANTKFTSTYLLFWAAGSSAVTEEICQSAVLCFEPTTMQLLFTL